MSNNSRKKIGNLLSMPVNISKSLMVLILVVTFLSGVFTEQFLIGFFFLDNINRGTTNVPNNNDNNGNGATNVTYPTSFRVDKFVSGYDKINGQYVIRFVVNVTETAGLAASCHLYLSVKDKNSQVYSSDQYIDFLPYQSKGQVFTWPVATEIWEQDLIVWSTASVIVAS